LKYTDSSVEIREAEVPPEVQALATEKRRVLIETLADVDDVIADKYLMEEEPTVQELHVCVSNIVLTAGCNSSGNYFIEILACFNGIRFR
jgi:translation elongation factor EF-G